MIDDEEEDRKLLESIPDESKSVSNVDIIKGAMSLVRCC